MRRLARGVCLCARPFKLLLLLILSRFIKKKQKNKWRTRPLPESRTRFCFQSHFSTKMDFFKSVSPLIDGGTSGTLAVSFFFWFFFFVVVVAGRPEGAGATVGVGFGGVGGVAERRAPPGHSSSGAVPRPSLGIRLPPSAGIVPWWNLFRFFYFFSFWVVGFFDFIFFSRWVPPLPPKKNKQNDRRPISGRFFWSTNQWPASSSDLKSSKIIDRRFRGSSSANRWNRSKVCRRFLFLFCCCQNELSPSMPIHEKDSFPNRTINQKHQKKTKTNKFFFDPGRLDIEKYFKFFFC